MNEEKVAIPIEGTDKIIYLTTEPPAHDDGLEFLDNYPELLTSSHLAELTGQSTVTMRALCSKGELPAVRIGKRWYVPKPSFLEYLRGGGMHAVQ